MVSFVTAQDPARCNLCGQEKPIVKEIWLTHSHSGEFNNEVRLNVSVYIPYGTHEGVCCEDCLRESFRHSGPLFPAPREPFDGEVMPDAH